MELAKQEDKANQVPNSSSTQHVQTQHMARSFESCSAKSSRSTMSSWRSNIKTSAFFSSRESGQSQARMPKGNGKLVNKDFPAIGAGGSSAGMPAQEPQELRRPGQELPAEVEAVDIRL